MALFFDELKGLRLRIRRHLEEIIPLRQTRNVDVIGMRYGKYQLADVVVDVGRIDWSI